MANGPPNGKTMPQGVSHLARLHEQRMGRAEERIEKVADDIEACMAKTEKGINALRNEFVDQITALREEMRRRPQEVVLYIVVGALLVLGGDTVRAIAERLLP